MNDSRFICEIEPYLDKIYAKMQENRQFLAFAFFMECDHVGVVTSDVQLIKGSRELLIGYLTAYFAEEEEVRLMVKQAIELAEDDRLKNMLKHREN